MTLDNRMGVELGFRIRPIRDGGGKPSQGRLPPPLRQRSPCGMLRKELAGGARHTHSPPTSYDNYGRNCSSTGDPGQPFHLDLLADLARSLQDPDWEYPKILKEGVPLGVTSPTLRTPDVWPTKEELRGEEDPYPEYPPLQGRDNYPSAKEFTKEIEATFEEEKTMGMVLGPMTQQEAAVICGCQPDQLCPGPMAGIQEADKVRTIFDGSWGGANTHIQSNTVERTTAPTVMDCVQALHWLHASKTTPLAPAQGGETGGSSTWSPPGPHQAWTHRRIKVLPTDWLFQIAQLGERSWWINKVGTYGMASAQLYWGRMAALLLRITYLIFYEVDWGFVFVDDFCWILRTESANLWATTILATYLALGVPLSWKKTVLAEVNTWLGFVVNPRTLVVRMAQDKHDIIMEILKKLSQGETFTSKAIEKALGHINWATSVCPLSRPFLQPFWAWKTACKSSGKPPKLVCLFAKMLSHIFSVPYHQPSRTSPWWGASDASATKDMSTGYPMIGGWISDLEFPDKKAVWWFQITITPEECPWAFVERDSSRRIAALEMLGTLLLATCLIQQGHSSLLRLQLALMSDNQGNVYALLNQQTRKMPTAAFLMQLVSLLYDRGAQLAPHHCKRDHNQCADDLTHPDPVGFTPERRLSLTPVFESFTFLPQILPDWKNPQSPHQPKAVKELGRTYLSTRP